MTKEKGLAMIHPFVIARGEAPKQSRQAEILRYAQDDRERAQDCHSRIQAGKFGYQELESQFIAIFASFDG